MWATSSSKKKLFFAPPARGGSSSRACAGEGQPGAPTRALAGMSIRVRDLTPPEFVRLNGNTMVSTRASAPSKLPLAVLLATGLPSGNNTCVHGEHILHVQFPLGNEPYAYVWAETRPSDGDGWCVVA